MSSRMVMVMMPNKVVMVMMLNKAVSMPLIRPKTICPKRQRSDSIPSPKQEMSRNSETCLDSNTEVFDSSFGFVCFDISELMSFSAVVMIRLRLGLRAKVMARARVKVMVRVRGWG